MTVSLPFLTAYDPAGVSEGALDPLGLYQIADQLAMKLVPAVRERMQRIRFLTAIAVGTRVLDGISPRENVRDADPFLIWEWLVVEALVRTAENADVAAGVAGVQVVKRAINRHNYVDARSYLKTPRIFGFHGVYKRLALQLKLVDVHLQPNIETERLFNAWADGIRSAGLGSPDNLISRCTAAVKRSLSQASPQSKSGWTLAEWNTLAKAIDPDSVRSKEKKLLRELLLKEGQLGAFASIWNLQQTDVDEELSEPRIHALLKKTDPQLAPLLSAISAYERFARALQDAFDCLRTHASTGRGFELSKLGAVREFLSSAVTAKSCFVRAETALIPFDSQRALFEDRFGKFAESGSSGSLANTLCAHHEAIQKAKSTGGKRAWFDRSGPGVIYLRPSYHLKEWKRPAREYVHDYRCKPIGRFMRDLS